MNDPIDPNDRSTHRDSPNSPERPESADPSAPPERPTWKSRRIDWLAWLAVALTTAWYAHSQVGVFLAEPGRVHANDFKHIYLGSLFLREGNSPYDADEFRAAAAEFSRSEDPRFRSILPYVYLPFTGVSLIPLTWFRFPTAVWIWFWINQLLLLGGGWLAARAVGLPKRASILALVLFLLAWNHPLSRTLTAGQLNAVLLFGYALVLWMTPRSPAWATGGVAAFVALFKITPAILFFWFLAEGKRRHAAWMAAGCVLLTATTLPLTGVKTWTDFLPVLREMGYGKSTWSQLGQRFYRDPTNQSLNSFYHHAFSEDPGGGTRPWVNLGPKSANAFTMADTLALIGATAWLVWPRRRRRDDSAAPEAVPNSPGIGPGVPSRADDSPLPLAVVVRYSLFVVLSLLIPSICWDHYLVLLVLPFLALSRHLLERGTGRVVLAFFAVSVVVTGAGIGFDAPPFTDGIGLLAMSAKLWSTVVVWALLAWALVRIQGQGEGLRTR